MKIKHFIPNQQKVVLKNQIRNSEIELQNSTLKCKEFLLALLSQMKKVI